MSEMGFSEVSARFLLDHNIYSRDRKTMRLRLVVVRRYLGHLELADIDQRAIKAMIVSRQAEGMAESTINRALAALSAVFRWAMEVEGYPGPNPVRKTRKLREGPGRLRYLSPAEADRLLLAAPPHLQGVIAVALHTGGRLGEILALTWGDLDLEAGVLTFRRETTKSRKTRCVPVCRALHAVLSDLRRGRPDQRIFTWNERPLRSVRTAFERARLKAGLEGGVVFHSLRHTFASWYVQNGGDLYRLQEYLGHATIGQTQRYAHLSREALEDGARFIGPPGRRVKTDTESL